MYYSPQMTTAAVLHHFRSVADRSPLPVMLYHIPKFVPYDFPVEVVAELAQHPNIIGIKDSSGNVARIHAIVQATQTAPPRTAVVTPIFEPVTARMLTSRTEAEATFVALWNLDRSRGRCASAGGPHQGHEQRGWISGAKRVSSDTLVRIARSRRFRSHSGVRRLRPAGVPGSLSRVEGSRPESSPRKAGAHRRSKSANRRRSRHQWGESGLRFQWLLWRSRAGAPHSNQRRAARGNRVAPRPDPQLISGLKNLNPSPPTVQNVNRPPN